jgi:hypothetical protein
MLTQLQANSTQTGQARRKATTTDLIGTQEKSGEIPLKSPRISRPITSRANKGAAEGKTHIVNYDLKRSRASGGHRAITLRPLQPPDAKALWVFEGHFKPLLQSG